MLITFPPRAGSTHISWPNSPPEHVAQGGGGGLTVIRNHPKAKRYGLAIWMITFVRPTEPLIKPVFERKVQSSAGIRDFCELLHFIRKSYSVTNVTL